MKDEIKEILDKPKILMLSYGNYISLDDYVKLKDYITNLQEKVDQYENPDDMTLMFMWCNKEAKDKIKQLQEENERLKENWKELKEIIQEQINNPLNVEMKIFSKMVLNDMETIERIERR